jgi:hypothetical protein
VEPYQFHLNIAGMAFCGYAPDRDDLPSRA